MIYSMSKESTFNKKKNFFKKEGKSRKNEEEAV